MLQQRIKPFNLLCFIIRTAMALFAALRYTDFWMCGYWSIIQLPDSGSVNHSFPCFKIRISGNRGITVFGWPQVFFFGTIKSTYLGVSLYKLIPGYRHPSHNIFDPKNFHFLEAFLKLFVLVFNATKSR